MRPISELLIKKREAVRLRLKGESLAQVKAKTGLSVPTIIRAVEAFKRSGWTGVDAPTRGRKPSIKETASDDKAALLAALLACSEQTARFVSVSDLLSVIKSPSGKALSKKTLLRRLEQAFPYVENSALLEQARSGLDRYKALVLGMFQLEEGFVFYTQDRRGERRFFYPTNQGDADYLTVTLLVAQLDILRKDASVDKPLLVVVKTDTLARYESVRQWQKENQDLCCLVAQGSLPIVKCIL